MGAQLHARGDHFLDFGLVHVLLITHFLVNHEKGALGIIFLHNGQRHAVIILVAIIKAQSHILIHALALLQALGQLLHGNHGIALLL